MSTAELRAREVYNTYNLGMLPSDVKRHLMILFLSTDSVEAEITTMPVVSLETLRARAETSYQEMQNGKAKPIDELLDNLSSKYSLS